ncbi:CapA family protein [Patescibacteria group bacterium]|nr:CapA family protein [Patescibacteria group bacterium]MBU1868346.1 CapA family protein [Patescibacteria group bacterium]
MRSSVEKVIVVLVLVVTLSIGTFVYVNYSLSFSGTELGRGLPRGDRVRETEEDVAGISAAVPIIEDTLLEPITLTFVGDIMLARGVQSRKALRVEKWPFDEIQDLIGQSDLMIGNLESLVGPESTECVDCLRFSIAALDAGVLGEAGFNLLSIANNHANDFSGNPGGTAAALRGLGLTPLGFVPGDDNIQDPRIMIVDDYTIGFLAYTDLSNTVFSNIARSQKDQITRDIISLTASTDFIAVNFHWGQEYTHQFTKRQQELAYIAVEAGADLVIGHHAHWVQGVEIYQQKAIFYGLGNCVFNMMFSQPTRQGIAVRATLDKSKSEMELQVIPLIIEDYARPRVLDKQEPDYLEILDVIEGFSPSDIELPQIILQL